jgi:hypothetical protein
MIADPNNWDGVNERAAPSLCKFPHALHGTACIDASGRELDMVRNQIIQERKLAYYLEAEVVFYRAQNEGASNHRMSKVSCRSRTSDSAKAPIIHSPRVKSHPLT